MLHKQTHSLMLLGGLFTITNVKTWSKIVETGPPQKQKVCLSSDEGKMIVTYPGDLWVQRSAICKVLVNILFDQ